MKNLLYLYPMKPVKVIRAILQAFPAFNAHWVAGLVALFAATPVRSQVVLNEIMADNVATVANDSGSYADWLELYNSGVITVNLGGYSLTDSPFSTNRNKYLFPPNTLIEPGGYLMVWCDTTNGPGELHTGFKLSSSGEYVAMWAPTGLVDTVTFGLQLTDLTVGRIPDGPTGVWTLNLPTPALANQSRALTTPFVTNDTVITTNLFINEWTATNGGGGDDWLELYSRGTDPIALGGLVFSSVVPPGLTTNRPIPALSYIGSIGFLKFNCVGNKSVKNADDLDFKLSHNSGETVSLYPVAGQTNVLLDRISFPGNTPGNPNYWPTNAIDVGVSYGRLPDGGTNIVQFARNKTTPAGSNFQSITNVVINEALSHTDPPYEDAIELYNPTTSDVDISHWWISNRAEDAKKFRIPPGTIVPALGYKVFYEQRGVTNIVPHIGFDTSQTGDAPDFKLNSAHGDSIYLFSGDAAGNLTGFRRAIDFGSAENGVSFGRYITSVGGIDITAMSLHTFGTNTVVTSTDFRMGLGRTNAYPKVGPLVISSIMYHPPDILVGTNYVDDTLNEYVEVYNISTNTVRLWDTNGLYFDNRVGIYADGRTNTWKLDGMVNMKFPTNVSLAAGQSLLLVNFNPVTNLTQLSIFRNRYGVPINMQIFGAYGGGKLKNGGGSVEIYKPDPPQSPDHPDFRYVPYIRVDKVNFSDQAPWPAADGTGRALQRRVMENYGNDPANWMASSFPPTPGRPYLHIDSPQAGLSAFAFQFDGWAGSSYSVQYSGDAVHWTKQTNFISQPSSGVRMISAPLTPSNRLYRVVTPLQP